MNLEWLAPTVGLLQGPINTIVVRSGGRALVIDPGLDRTAADRIGKALAASNLTPAALLFTHAHADHSGACHYLQRQMGLPVFGPPFETEIAASPLLALDLTTVNAFPADLARRGRIVYRLADNRMFWRAATSMLSPHKGGRHGCRVRSGQG